MAKKQKFTEEGMFKILSEARGALKKKTNGTVNIKYDDDTSRYSKFLKTLPDNLRNTDIKNYNLYGMWEAAGKPSSFEDVQDTEFFPLQEDGTYHGFSVGNDGMFLKSKTHPSAWQEYMVSQLNPELYNNYTVKVNPEGYFGENQLQYQPNTPETWEENIRSVEEQIGNPSQWTMDDYNRLQNKLNEYKNWRENTEKGRTVIDSHNEPNEYVIPLPNHLLNKFAEGGSNTSYKEGTNLPIIEDAGSFNEENVWIPDWEAITEQAKKLGAKTVKTKSGVIINFDKNWQIKNVDDNPNYLLNKFVDGGSNISCEEGYYWNPDTQSCEPINAINSIKESKQFLQDMANSPLFAERYTRMTGVTDPNKIEKYRQEIINNLNTVKYKEDPEYLKVAEAAGVYSPGIFKKRHTIYRDSKDSSPETDLHELSHSSTKGFLNYKNKYTYEPYHLKNLYAVNDFDDRMKDLKDKDPSKYKNIMDFENALNFLYDTKKKAKYLLDSTEVKARIDVMRKGMQDAKLYDPVKENFTEEHFDKLKKLFLEKSSDNLLNAQDYLDILHNYSKEDIIDFFNNMVSNNPKDNSSMAKFGGAFYNNPLEKFILGGNKPPVKTKTKAKVNKPSLDLKMELKTMPSETIQSVIPASLKNLPKSIKEVEKREVEKQKIEKKALEEVARTGVIPDYAPENVKLYYTVEPTSYYDFSNAKRYVKNIARNPENTTMLAADEDAWKKYLGLMDDSENIRKSTARPSKGKSDGQYYKLSEEVEDKLFYEIMDKLRNQKDTSFVVNEYDVTNKAEDMETGVTPYSALGNFTIGRGTDPISNKPYVSYYDKYDFDSAPWFIKEKLERSGTPYEFYNRFYPPTLKTPLGKSVEFGDDMYWNVYQKKREEQEKERRRIIENDEYKTGGEKDKNRRPKTIGTNEEPVMLPEVTITPQTRQQMQFADAYKNMPEDVKKAIAYDIENPDMLSPAQEEQSYLGRGFDAITHPFTALNELHNRRGLGSNWLELNQAQNGPNFMDWSLYGAAAARLAPFVAGRLLPNVFNYNLGSLVGTQIPGATLGNALASEMIVNSALRETGLKGEQDPSTIREWEKYSEGSQDLATTLANTGMNALDALAYGELKPFKSQLIKDLKNTGEYLTTQTPSDIQQRGFFNLKGAMQKYPKGPLTKEEIEAYKNSDFYKEAKRQHEDALSKYGDKWTLPNYAEKDLQEAIETGNRNRINPTLYGGSNWSALEYLATGLIGFSYPTAASLYGLAFSPPAVKNKVLQKTGIIDPRHYGTLTDKDTIIDITERPMDFAKVNQIKDGQIIIGGEFIEDANNTVRKAKDWLNATDTYSDKDYQSKDIQSFYGIENGKFKVGKASDFKSETEIVPRRFGAINIDKAILNGKEMRLLDKEGNPIYQNTPNTGKFILYSPSTGKAQFTYINTGKSGVEKVNTFLKKNKDAQYIHLDNGRYEYYGINPEGLTEADFKKYYQQDLERKGNPGYNLILKKEGGNISNLQKFIK